MLPESITAATAFASPEPRAPSSLGQQDFLKMLIAQLENQDPLSPQDATEFSAQLAQFSSLEQLLSIGEGMQEVVEAQGALTTALQGLASTGLIGREVVAAGSRIELGVPGTPSTTPAFELPENASQVELRITQPNGFLQVLELGPLGQGFHAVSANQLEASGLAPGVYDFEVVAGSGERDLSAATRVVGRVTGATPVGGDALVQLGGVVVPYAEITEVRE